MKKIPIILEYLLLSVLSLILIIAPYFRHQVKWFAYLSFGLWLVLKLFQLPGQVRKGIFVSNTLKIPLIVFACVSLLAVLLSQSFYHSQKILLNRFLSYGMFFVIGADMAFASRRNFFWLIYAFLFSAGLLAIGCIRDYFLFHPSRLYTSFGKAIPFAMLPIFITYYFPFNFALYFLCKNRGLKIFSLFNLLLLLPCVVWQGARAAWVAIAVGVLFTCVFMKRKFAISVALVLLMIFLYGLCFPGIRQKLETIPHPSQWNYRTPLFDSALKVFKDYPVKGAGLGMFEKLIKEPRYALPADYPNADRSIYLHAHSLYLELLAEMGIVGLVAFGYLFFAYFYCIFVYSKKVKDTDYQAAIIGIAALVAAVLVSGVAGSIVTVGVNEAFMFWVLLGISVGLLSKKNGIGTAEKSQFSSS